MSIYKHLGVEIYDKDTKAVAYGLDIDLHWQLHAEATEIKPKPKVVKKEPTKPLDESVTKPKELPKK
jgi:hypothetical protein